MNSSSSWSIWRLMLSSVIILTSHVAVHSQADRNSEDTEGSGMHMDDDEPTDTTGILLSGEYSNKEKALLAGVSLTSFCLLLASASILIITLVIVVSYCNEDIDMKECSAYGIVASSQSERGQQNENVYELVA